MAEAAANAHYVGQAEWGALVPDTQRLTGWLRQLIDADLEVIDRRANVYASSFPTEMVTVRLRGGQALRLFCKYGVEYDDDGSGVRGGVPHEATVYRDVLPSVSARTPVFYGTALDAGTGKTWLVVEDLEGAVRASKQGTLGEGLGRAARWSGRFHRETSLRLEDGWRPPLPRMKADGFLRWPDRVIDVFSADREAGRWLRPLSSRYPPVVERLLTAPPCVIHGEYTVKNVLLQGQDVVPVDWEWAAIGPGEIDIAMLTERWSEETVKRCEGLYAAERWPEDGPVDLAERLDIARLHVSLRWLARGRQIWRLDIVRAVGQRLGLI